MSTESTASGSKEGLADVLAEVQALGHDLLGPAAASDLAAARERLLGGQFNLVVLGEFKRGKSTLINALLGRGVLPTGVVPLTSVVTVLAGAECERLLIHFRDGRVQEQPLSDLPDYVTEARNPANRLGVELAQIELDHPLLRSGVQLVDTPGVGSIHEHNSQAARDFLPRVDAAIFVLDAGQPVSESERALLVQTAERVPRWLVVVNKIDHLDESDLPTALEFIRGAIGDLLGSADPPLFAISARRSLGLRPLADHLRELAANERASVLRASVAGLARAAVSDIAQAARLEARAIVLPLDQLEQRAHRFEQRIGELRSAAADAADLLDRGLDRVLRSTVNEPLTAYAGIHADRLSDALRSYAEELRGSSARGLSERLEAWIDATVRAEFASLVLQVELEVSDQLVRLEREHSERIEQILDGVQEAGDEVFGAGAVQVRLETGLRDTSQFSFKLEDVEHAVDIIVGFGRTIAPGALGRRLVIRDAERRLELMVDRHAGRLRSELVARATASAREFERELAGVVEQAVSTIRDAIGRATADRGRGQRYAAERLQQLEATQDRCRGLASELARWAG